ncbi:hypothetical protein M3629_14915 [Paenibacillus polysaccharolyticus]|uniref:hypothetical protein n=1 Tax=Paenibacillus polysaccharolyticus TaxID=582692 RepID=UPI00204113F1|nr:hypothetical protein [Paenibacillus polysaccharolyticus]MCM3134081.1 hypothetical protein [Paenibacillus polysaccharolyticus]
MASAFVLVEENSNISIDRLVRDIRQVCLESNLHLTDGIQDVDSEQNMKHCALGISCPNQEESDHGKVNNTIRVDVYDEPALHQYRELEWREDGQVYFNTLIIDEVYQNEEVTLTFLYNFLTRHPQMIVWIEEDWVYTLSDLDKALKTSNLSDWCYVNPNSL